MSGVWQHGPHGWRTKPRSPALPPRDRKCHTRPRAESSGSARSSAAGLVIYAPRHSPTRGHTVASGKRSLASGSQADTRLGLLGRLPRWNNPDPAKYAHCMVRRVLTVLFRSASRGVCGSCWSHGTAPPMATRGPDRGLHLHSYLPDNRRNQFHVPPKKSSILRSPSQRR